MDIKPTERLAYELATGGCVDVATLSTDAQIEVIHAYIEEYGLSKTLCDARLSVAHYMDWVYGQKMYQVYLWESVKLPFKDLLDEANARVAARRERHIVDHELDVVLPLFHYNLTTKD